MAAKISAEREKLVITGYQQQPKVPVKDVAASAEIGVRAVYRVLDRLKVPRRKGVIPPEKEASIIAAYLSDRKIYEVLETETIDKKQLYEILARNGVPTRQEVRKRMAEAEQRRAAELVAIELTADRIRRFIGPKAIAEFLGLESPHMVVSGKQVERPEVVLVRKALFDRHGLLLEERELLAGKVDGDLRTSIT